MRPTRPGARLGLFLAAVALLPGVLALLASGAGGVPATGLALTEAAGAFSVAALQGIERRLADGPVSVATVCALPAATLAPPSHEPSHLQVLEVAAATPAPHSTGPLRL